MQKKSNVGLYIIIVILCIALTVAVCFIVFNKDNKVNNQEEIKQTDISLNKDDNQGRQSEELDNQTISNQSNIDNKSISNETKKELLSLVGLTENGFERTSGNIIEDGNFMFNTISSMSENNMETIIKNSSTDKIKDLILIYAINNKMLNSERNNNITIPDIEPYSSNCKIASGVCMGLSFSDYKIIAKKYNLNENGNVYFNNNEIYNNYYLFSEFGSTSGPARIEDNLSFEKSNGNIVLYYNIKLYNYENNNLIKNEKITYKFKQYDDGTYYLHSVKVIKL